MKLMEDFLFEICLRLKLQLSYSCISRIHPCQARKTINGWNDPPINFEGIKWRSILIISPSYREVLRILPFRNGNNIKLTMNHKMINKNDLRL